MKGECIGLGMILWFQQVASCNGLTDDDRVLHPVSFWGLILPLVWFFFCIWWADLSFYLTHVVLHQPRFYAIHKQHHLFQNQVAWSAEVKTLTESVIVSITDLWPHLMLDGYVSYLLAWVCVGTLYNLEGHSGLNIWFMTSGFHDWHHTMNTGNFGIAFYLHELFSTSAKWKSFVAKGAAS